MTKRIVKRADVESVEPLQAGDSIEYGITLQIESSDRRSKAWVKYGTVSSVRASEDTGKACKRIDNFVEQGLAERVQSLLEDL